MIFTYDRFTIDLNINIAYAIYRKNSIQYTDHKTCEKIINQFLDEIDFIQIFSFSEVKIGTQFTHNGGSSTIYEFVIIDDDHCTIGWHDSDGEESFVDYDIYEVTTLITQGNWKIKNEIK